MEFLQSYGRFARLMISATMCFNPDLRAQSRYDDHW